MEYFGRERIDLALDFCVLRHWIRLCHTRGYLKEVTETSAELVITSNPITFSYQEHMLYWKLAACRY